MPTKSLPEVVPAPAKMLLDFIRSIEAPRGYDTIFGNNQDKLPVRLTFMTLDQVIAEQVKWSKKFGSSAAGGLQFMRATLQRIKQDTGIPGDVLFAAGLQDRLGYYLLLGRGYARFLSGNMSMVAFGKALAQEWASFPVLADTMGAHRQVKRGETYYAGDKLNKVLVTPDRVEAKLQDVLDLAASLAKRKPAPAPVEPIDLPMAPSSPGRAVPTEIEPPPPIAPEKLDPEKLDKPLMKSKTVWQWIIVTVLGPVLAWLSDWRVQLAIIFLIALFAAYAIKRRWDIGKVYRTIKQELGS